MIMQRWKEQKQVVIEHKTLNIYSSTLFIYMGVNITNKKRNEKRNLYKTSMSLKLINGVSQYGTGVRKNRQINKST